MRRSHALLAFVALLFVWNTWGYDLWAPDEPYFGEGAREMIVDGHWAVPYVNGEINTHKPAFFFWLIALLSLPLGEVTPLTARLPSVLAAVGCVWLTLRLGRRMTAREGPALLAGCVLSTSYLFWRQARSAQIDAVLCFMILVALSAFEAHRSGSAAGRRAGWLFWLATALAVLAKGPVGLLLPLGVALVTLAFDRDLRAWKRFAPWSGPLLFLAVVGAWMAVATFGSGGQYSVWGAFREHVLERAVHGMHHAQPFWYYLGALPPDLMPWTGFLPGALWLAWKRRSSAPDRFLLVWVVFVVLLFSISTEKRDLYVLPAFPALALLLSRFAAAVDEAAPRLLSRLWGAVPSWLVAVVLVTLGLLVMLLAPEHAQLPAWISRLVGVLIVLTGAAAGYVALRGGVRRWVLVTATGLSLIYFTTVSLAYPALNHAKSAREFAAGIRRAVEGSVGAERFVPSLDLGNLPTAFAFYTNGIYFPELRDVDDLAVHLRRSDRAFAVVQPAALERLPPDLREHLVVVASTHLSRRDVVLIHNGAPAG